MWTALGPCYDLENKVNVHNWPSKSYNLERKTQESACGHRKVTSGSVRLS